MSSRTKRPGLPGLEQIGWRERVALPDLGIHEMKAKIDTGARTSALHAVEVQTFQRDGHDWASFVVPLLGRERRSARLVDQRPIKNTSGIPETRLVVETTLLLGAHRWRIEASLANREKMEFDLILGRTAIRRHKLLVDPGRSFLAGPPVGRKAPVRRVAHPPAFEPAVPVAPQQGDEEE
ncbi:MAG: ATP-dependent zinc protease [Rhodobacteraceae bacterium]|nr:ATP-dependent zinc protease [Paracoccaceae bacterium]